MKTQKGITLIALIITIIVMLILVGVSVSVALNTGLFKTAQGAAKNTEAERANETKLSNGTVNIGGTETDIEDYVDALTGKKDKEMKEQGYTHKIRTTVDSQTYEYYIIGTGDNATKGSDLVAYDEFSLNEDGKLMFNDTYAVVTWSAYMYNPTPDDPTFIVPSFSANWTSGSMPAFSGMEGPMVDIGDTNAGICLVNPTDVEQLTGYSLATNPSETGVNFLEFDIIAL